MTGSVLGVFLVHFGDHFWRVPSTFGSGAPRGAAKFIVLSSRFRNLWCSFCECDRSGENRDLRVPMGRKFSIFEKFYFLVFRFGWSILHQHRTPRLVRSAQAGSPGAFYTLHFEPQSGGDLKRFSVNGLPIKITAKIVRFRCDPKIKNRGVHARP